MEHYDEYLDRVNWGPSEPLHNWLAHRIITILVRKLDIKPNDSNFSICEIGSGTGRIATAIQNLGITNYQGVEPNLSLANYTRGKGFNVSSSELPDLPKQWDATFSAVVSLHVIEHAPTYLDARNWLKEMNRITKPGGVVLIATPDIRDYGNYFWDSDWSHGWPATPQRISQLMKDLNIKPIYVGSLHLGSTSGLAAFVAHLINLFIPTRIVDALSMALVKRPLASGLKIATLWGMTYVIGQKTESN